MFWFWEPCVTARLRFHLPSSTSHVKWNGITCKLNAETERTKHGETKLIEKKRQEEKRDNSCRNNKIKNNRKTNK